jgi:lipopolysaccharide biosynthesis glycosyltransferase
MKKTALVTGGTAKDIPAIAALILNITETNNNLVDDIIIFHNGISKKDQILIKKIIPVQFRVYKYHGNTNRFNDVVNKYFSTMIFCKYECFKLLNEYKTVIWTDYDVVLNNDISELLMPSPSGFRMMPDINNTVKSMFFFLFNSEIKNYNLNISGICMSLFVLFDNMIKYNEYYEYCRRQTDKYAPYLYLPEQCVINLLLQDYNIDVNPIDFNIYCANPRLTEITDATKIIHAYSQPKFWNGLYNSTWEKNYKKWLNMGGSDFIPPKKSFKDKIRLIIHPVIYQKLKSIYKKLKHY